MRECITHAIAVNDKINDTELEDTPGELLDAILALNAIASGKDGVIVMTAEYMSARAAQFLTDKGYPIRE